MSEAGYSLYRVMTVSLTVDLIPLSFFLYRQGIAHKITEESGSQVLWTDNERLVAIIVKHYQDWQAGLLTLEVPPQRKRASLSSLIAKVNWRQYPVTLLLLMVSIVIALVSGFGQVWTILAGFNFVPIFKVSDGAGGFTLYANTLSVVFEEGQYWRLITPIFLHFNTLHLVFNMLWLFEFGKRIETRQGGLHLSLLILTTGIASNYIQFFWEGAGIFGGFSGVIFGLLGYCFVRERLDKSCQFGVLPAIYVFMFIYLVIGYTGVLDGIVGGSVANGAHTGGLLSGTVAGLLAAILLRKKTNPPVDASEC